VAGLTIRYARLDDLSRLTGICNHYIRSSHAMFDERSLKPEDRRVWLEVYRETGPYRLLVAERERDVIGYASSNRYREHPAFDATIETSVYVDPSAVGQGIGRALYGALFTAIRGEDLHRALAGIALPNPASIALHERFNFRSVGVFDQYARKNGERISSVWMERALDGAW
jgi:phosphinothricin acetyltransferase